MKKEYIKPIILGIITLPEKLMDEFASNYSGPTSGKVTEDDSSEGSEVDAESKGFNAWTTWDEF